MHNLKIHFQNSPQKIHKKRPKRRFLSYRFLAPCLLMVWTQNHASTYFDPASTIDTTIAPHQPHSSDAPFTVNERVRPFLYLDNPLYNDYPFSLPACAVLKNTLHFGDNAAVQTAIDQPEIKELMEKTIRRFIVSDGVDLTPLQALEPESAAYGFHFFGKYTPNFGNIKAVFEAWQERNLNPWCAHLDIAFLDIQDDTTRQSMLESLVSFINSPACENLETLSLRWMGLKHSHLTFLTDEILKINRSLKRLILSFNDLDNTCLGDGGCLVNMIRATDQLPQLSYLDLKGNALDTPINWNINPAIRARFQRARRSNGTISFLNNIVFNFNGIPKSSLDVANVQFSMDALNCEPFERFSSADARHIKEIGSWTTFKPTWVVSQGHYAHMADPLVPLRHGMHRQLSVINLRGARLEHDDLCTFLQHISHPELVKTLNLSGSFKEGVPVDEDVHDKISQLIQSFENLEFLDLSDNHLAYYCWLNANLQGFAFAGNALKASEDCPEDPTHEMLRDLDASLDRMQYINLSHQSLGVGEEQFLLNILKRGMSANNALAMMILSHNQLGLGADEADQIRWISQLSAAQRQGKPFLLLDITNNAITYTQMKAFINAYQKAIAERPDTHWPVIQINGRLESGLYSEPVMISNDSGFKALADFYTKERTQWDDHWKRDEGFAQHCMRNGIMYEKGYTHVVRRLGSESTIRIVAPMSHPMVVKAVKDYLGTDNPLDNFNNLVQKADGFFCGVSWLKRVIDDVETGLQHLGAPDMGAIDSLIMTFVQFGDDALAETPAQYGLCIENKGDATKKILVHCGLGDVIQAPPASFKQELDEKFEALHTLKREALEKVDQLEVKLRKEPDKRHHVPEMKHLKNLTNQYKEKYNATIGQSFYHIFTTRPTPLNHRFINMEIPAPVVNGVQVSLENGGHAIVSTTEEADELYDMDKVTPQEYIRVYSILKNS